MKNLNPALKADRARAAAMPQCENVVRTGTRDSIGKRCPNPGDAGLQGDAWLCGDCRKVARYASEKSAVTV